jgi:hypothetical protein
MIRLPAILIPAVLIPFAADFKQQILKTPYRFGFLVVSGVSASLLRVKRYRFYFFTGCCEPLIKS